MSPRGEGSTPKGLTPKISRDGYLSKSCSTTKNKNVEFLLTVSLMKSDDPESDKTVSISQIQQLVSRQLPRVITAIPGKKSWSSESDNGGVARATVTHSETGTKVRRKPRKLVSELAAEVKRGKGRARRRRSAYSPSVDTSRARASSDVVRLAVKELGWREVR